MLSSPQKFLSSTQASFPSPTFKLTAPKEVLPRLSSPMSNQKVHKKNTKTFEITKNQYKLGLTAEHNIIRSMAIADREQEALKDNSSLTHGFKRMSAGIKVLRNDSNRPELLTTVLEHIQPIHEKRLNGKLQNIALANKKWMSSERARWIKIKGLEPGFQDSRVFIEFLRQLFDAFDEKDTGRLKIEEIVYPLLAFGLYPDYYYIETTFKVIFHIKESNEYLVDKEDFVNMFKEDSKTDRILQFLETHSKNLIKTEKNNRRCESAPIKNIEDINPISEENFCNVEQYLKLLKLWWNEAKPVNDRISLSKAGDLLAEKNIVSNKHEGTRIAKEISNSNIITYNDFEKVFLKAILKASLINLASTLQNNLGSSDQSLRLKLSNYQRAIMIRGNDPDEDFRLGKNTMQAISKYQKNKTGPDNKGFKQIQSFLNTAEEENEERIKAYLYRVKKHAKEFVNDKGEVVTNIKNTWDIRDLIHAKYAKMIPTVLEEEQTFDEQKYINELSKDKKLKVGKGPILRKIKVFRENYILEKYQKIIANPRNSNKIN